MKTNPVALVFATTALLGSPVLFAGNTAFAPVGAKAVASVEKPPVAIKKACPVYPSEMTDLGIHGTATVEMTVGTDGRVSAVKLLDATEREFGDRAVVAAQLWMFTPGTANGVPIVSKVRVPFEFVPKK